MRLAALALALHDPADELDGTWPREQLLEMDSRFTAALERAFELELERRSSARAQVALPASRSAPRWTTPLTREIQEGLWCSSAAANALVFVAR